MIKFLILDKNERLNINKNTETVEEIIKKLNEEHKELIEALEQGTDIDHIIEEALDGIQVKANLVDRYSNKNMSLEKQINLHNMKLIGRGWEFKKEFEIKQI